MFEPHLFIDRRKLLLEACEGRPYILTASRSMQLSHDMAAPFQQEANFLYLTGITDPDWRLIVENSGKSWLVLPYKSEIEQLFDGGVDAEEAKSVSGIEEIITQDEALQVLKRISFESNETYTLGEDPYSSHYSFVENPAQEILRAEITSLFETILDCRPQLAALRAHKTPPEITVMRKAAHLTVEAFTQVKKMLSDLSYEYEVEAEFSYYFRRHEGATHAYNPIIAGGAHACTLHYGRNDDILPQNGLVLMDVGARVGGYAADITRTYAIGTPTEREKAVHAAVEKAHHEIIALLHPGLVVKTYHEKVDDIMKHALKSLDLLKTPEEYRRYFPHAISHGLGIDVHDSLGGPEVFKPDMVLTVEPGIYIPEEGIGVRIEDNILITSEGHENLSGALPTGL